MGGFRAYRLSFVRPLSCPFPPFGQPALFTFMANRATAREIGNTVKAGANTLWKRAKYYNVILHVRNCRRLRGLYRVTKRPRMKTPASL